MHLLHFNYYILICFLSPSAYLVSLHLSNLMPASHQKFPFPSYVNNSEMLSLVHVAMETWQWISDEDKSDLGVTYLVHMRISPCLCRRY